MASTRHAPTTVRVIPANEATADDLDLIFGARGIGAACRCQRYKLARGESFAKVPDEVRRQRMLEQTDCGHPGGGATSGLVGYLDGEPVGWCAVEPRRNYHGLARSFRVPWDGRDEDRDDPDVWAITCVFTRTGYRKRGVSRALARAAVEYAEDRGAAAVEAYPILTAATIPEEQHVGALSIFLEAGMHEVCRPTRRRAVTRIDFR